MSSVIKSFGFLMNSCLIKRKKLLICLCITNIVLIAQSYILVLIPKVIAGNLDHLDILVSRLLLFSGFLILFYIVRAICSNISDFQFSRLRFGMFREVNRRKMELPYAAAIAQEAKDRYRHVIDWVDRTDIGLQASVQHVFRFFASVLLFFLYTLTISFVRWELVLFIVCAEAVNFALMQLPIAYERDKMPLSNNLDSQARTFSEIARRPSYGKDIRIFQAQEYFHAHYQGISGEKLRLTERIQARYQRSNMLCTLIAAGKDFILFFYLIFLTAENLLALEDFVLLMGLAAGLSGNLLQIFQTFSDFARDSMHIMSLKEFLAGEDLQKGESLTELPEEGWRQIAFEHVYFKYKADGDYVLKDINLKISPEEKIAVVGLNGAGKTTLTLLMLGLLRPSKGRITINGVDIRRCNPHTYLQLFSAVFQELNTTAFTIGEQIAGCEADAERVWQAPEKSGLKQRIEKTPKRLDTYIQKVFDEEGIELSGGEKQKLAIARALYKDSPIIILDEPTSALDPLSEMKLYRKYDELFLHKTVLYITHRLSSVKFCRKIILLENGELKECGAHEELLKLGGTYAALFQLQKKSYGLEPEGAVQ